MTSGSYENIYEVKKKQADDFIEKCKEERNRLKSLPFETFGTVHEFPKAEARYSKNSIRELMQIICNAKQLLPVGR